MSFQGPKTLLSSCCPALPSCSGRQETATQSRPCPFITSRPFCYATHLVSLKASSGDLDPCHLIHCLITVHLKTRLEKLVSCSLATLFSIPIVLPRQNLSSVVTTDQTTLFTLRQHPLEFQSKIKAKRQQRRHRTVSQPKWHSQNKTKFIV